MRKFIELGFIGATSGKECKVIVPVKNIVTVVGDSPTSVTIKHGSSTSNFEVTDSYESIRAKLDLVEAPEPIPMKYTIL